MVEVPSVGLDEEVGGAVGIEAIAITPPNSGKAGMPAVRDWSGGSNHNILWQVGIENFSPMARGDGAALVEVGDLGGGVNSAIGAACSVEGDWFSDNLSDRLFNFRLHGTMLKLSLPTVEVGSQVLNHESDALLRWGSQHRAIY
jgi:hypothetical protein